MAIKYTKASKVYSCCGKYLAADKNTVNSGSTLKCPSCGRVLNNPLQVPVITLITKS